MTNLQTVHASGRVETHRHLSALVALDMFRAFSAELARSDEAEYVRGDERIVKVTFVG